MNRDCYWLPFGLMVAGLATIPVSTMVQAQIPACQPPLAGEYLLLVVTPTAENQQKVRQTLPPNVNPMVCAYLDKTVTRIEGFTDLEVANSWARYMTEIVGLQAFVAKPVQSASPAVAIQPTPVPPSPTPRPTPSTPLPTSQPTPPSPPTGISQPVAFNPQLLGSGHAVLVDYFNDPNVATQVKQVLGRDVGLVSYGQRPYLLANHVANPEAADQTLKVLTDNGFLGLIVDSRQVVLLQQRVAR